MAKRAKAFTYEISFKEAEFDSEQPVIRNVVLLGAESKNKRRYTEKCMKAAVGLYENVQAFVNHPTKSEEQDGMRDVRNMAGKFHNVRFESMKIRADFKGLPDDPAAKKFISIAHNMPEIAGLSQNASGKVRREGGIEIVESIEKVLSVDLVANPATTKGMYENHDHTGESKMDYADVTMIGLKEGRKDLVEKLIAEGKASRGDEIKKLKEENTALENKLDEVQVAEALRTKEAAIDKILAESKLPTEAKTDIFRKTLLNVVEVAEGEKLEDKVEELIDDRMTAVTGKVGVKNNTEKQKNTKESTDELDAQTLAEELKATVVI